MKNIKTYIVVLSLAAAFSLSGCGNSTSSNTEPTTAATVYTSAAPSQDEEKIAEGTILDAATHTIMLKLDDGTEMTFTKDENSEIEGSVMQNNTVTITYTENADGQKIIKTLK